MKKIPINRFDRLREKVLSILVTRALVGSNKLSDPNYDPISERDLMLQMKISDFTEFALIINSLVHDKEIQYINNNDLVLAPAGLVSYATAKYSEAIKLRNKTERDRRLQNYSIYVTLILTGILTIASVIEACNSSKESPQYQKCLPEVRPSCQGTRIDNSNNYNLHHHPPD